MNMATRIVIVVLAAMLAAFPARAATTIYASSIYSETGVSNSASALFAANGSAALIAPGGELVLQFGNPLTGAGLNLSLLPFVGPGANFVAVSVGEIISGVAVYSAGSIAFADLGVGGASGFDLTALCSTASATGCSLVRIQNIASFGVAGVSIDGISGVSNAPEPAAWALMMFGFAGVAWRLKQSRKQTSHFAGKIVKGAAPA